MKFLIVILAGFGTFFLLKKYAPSVWVHGFTFNGTLVPVAFVLIAIVCFMALKLKA